ETLLLRAEQAALPAGTFAPSRAWLRFHRGWAFAVCGCADATVGKLDVEARPRPNRRGCPQRTAVTITHQRKTAREHAAIGISGQQLPGAAQARDAAVAENPEGAMRAITERRGLLPAPLDAVRQQPR